MRTAQIIVAALFFASCGPQADDPATGAPLDLANFEMVDLTHSFGADTVYWPTDKQGFRKEVVFEGAREDGLFYSAFSFATAEHGGTHMDAPYHFSADGLKVEDVPLSALLAPVVVIDARAEAAADRDYLLSLAAIAEHERAHGDIAKGSIVLMMTGWSARWPDRAQYLGGTDPADLHFPSFGEAAAKFLVEERGAVALGLDTASTDHGPSAEFPVHRVLGAANAPGFENLARLERLPATGAYLFALPMKIEGGSGGPLRAVALVPRRLPA